MARDAATSRIKDASKHADEFGSVHMNESKPLSPSILSDDPYVHDKHMAILTCFQV